MKQPFFDENYQKVDIDVGEPFVAAVEAASAEDIALAARVLINEKRRHSETSSAAVGRGRKKPKSEWLIFKRDKKRPA